jgi:hypothetical protein
VQEAHVQQQQQQQQLQQLQQLQLQQQQQQLQQLLQLQRSLRDRVSVLEPHQGIVLLAVLRGALPLLLLGLLLFVIVLVCVLLALAVLRDAHRAVAHADLAPVRGAVAGLLLLRLQACVTVRGAHARALDLVGAPLHKPD